MEESEEQRESKELLESDRASNYMFTSVINQHRTREICNFLLWGRKLGYKGCISLDFINFCK